MDPITLIVTALAAGSSGGAISALQDDVKATVVSAHAKLRVLAKKCVAGQPGADLVLTEHEADPETWGLPLAKKLTDARAADDVNLVAAAKGLMELIDATGTAAGKYNVTIESSQGLQFGDHNIQVNRFGG